MLSLAGATIAGMAASPATRVEIDTDLLEREAVKAVREGCCEGGAERRAAGWSNL